MSRVLPVLVIGYLGNAILPARLGEPIRAYLLARREALSSSTTLGSVVLERVIDTTTLALVGLAAAILLGSATWLVQLTLLISLVGGAVLAVLAGGTLPLMSRLTSLAGRWPALEPWLAHLERFLRGAGGVHSLRSLILAAGISATAWMMDALSIWLTANALGIQLSPGSAIVISAIATLATALPAAPGYVGTYELAATAAARVFGVPESPALALALLAHALTIVPPMIAGAISLSLLGESFERLVTGVRGNPAPGSQAS